MSAGLVKAMQANKKMLEDMESSVKTMAESVTALTESLTKQEESVDKTTKSLKELAKEKKKFTRRLAIVKTVAEQNNDVFEFGVKTLKEFREAGGTTFEYFGLLLSGSSEQLRLFGFEVQGIRRFLIGFMPAGTFSAMSRFATIFNTIGGFVRFVRGDVDKLQGSFKGSLGMMKKLLPNFKPLMKMREGEKEHLALAARDIQFDPATGRYKEGGRFVKTKLGKQAEKSGIKAVRARRAQFREIGNLATGGFFRGIKSKGDFFGFQPGESMRDRVGRSPLVKMIKALTLSNGWKALTFVGKMLAKGIGKLMKGALMFFITVARFTLYFTLMITTAFILFHALKTPLMEAFEFLKVTLGIALFVIGEGFRTVFEGVREIYTAFKNGDFFGVLMGVWTVVWGILQIAFGLLVGVIGGLGALAVGFISGLWNGAKSFFNDIITKPLDHLGKIAILVGAIAGLIFGWPVVIAGLIFMAVGALFKKLKFFGDGGVSTGGMAVVGERGPELVNLPRGSRVHSSTQSRKMTSSSNVFNITINARDTSDAELRRIADKIGNMVNNKVNRRTGSGTLG